MKRLLSLMGMALGGWAGWMLGAWVSIFTAFITSVVGTALGLYFTRRVTRNLLP